MKVKMTLRRSLFMVAGAEIHGTFRHLLLIQIKGGSETAA